MKCPFCGNGDTQVVDSRVSEEGDSIRRRRRCAACDRRFTTYERMELLMPAVVKRDGSRMEFDDKRLRASLDLAFTVYALDVEELPLEGKFGGAEAKVAMQGHILAQASLTGTYTLNEKLL